MSLPRKVARRLTWSRHFLALAKLGFVKRLADKKISLQPEGPSAEQRLDAKFKVLASAHRGDERVRCLVEAHDPYGITATIAVAGARSLLKSPPKSFGVISTSMAFNAEEFLNELKESYVKWGFVPESNS